jgi:hypothetical protein
MYAWMEVAVGRGSALSAARMGRCSGRVPAARISSIRSSAWDTATEEEEGESIIEGSEVAKRSFTASVCAGPDGRLASPRSPDAMGRRGLSSREPRGGSGLEECKVIESICTGVIRVMRTGCIRRRQGCVEGETKLNNWYNRTFDCRYG